MLGCDGGFSGPHKPPQVREHASFVRVSTSDIKTIDRGWPSWAYYKRSTLPRKRIFEVVCALGASGPKRGRSTVLDRLAGVVPEGGPVRVRTLWG